jgi:heptosyltransferase-2
VNAPGNILIFQTAFLGDVVLTLPLAQALKQEYPGCRISFAVIPAAASVLEGHPAVHAVITYDKKKSQRGLGAAYDLSRTLRGRGFDLALIPHRSMRSALIVAAARIPRRVGFDTSAGRALLTDRVTYRRDLHEIDRDLSLLEPLGLRPPVGELLPTLHPLQRDREAVDALLLAHQARVARFDRDAMVALAPGSVWNTKRWPEEKFVLLARDLHDAGLDLVLIGGREDRPLCGRIAAALGEIPLNAAGELSPLQSAELIRRCRVLVSNDSAPAHLAAGVRTPVVALFGATVPSFGFAPRGPSDRVIETAGLSCRPCSIHGGQRCPIATFDCMERINPQTVHDAVIQIARRPNRLAGG